MTKQKSTRKAGSNTLNRQQFCPSVRPLPPTKLPAIRHTLRFSTSSFSLGLGIFGFFFCGLIQSTLAENESALTIHRLRCEYRTNPSGIEVTRPRLSWAMQSPRRGEKQIAYQVLVASSQSKLDHDVGDLWDSGRVESDKSNQVIYQGHLLNSRADCFWKVRLWDIQQKPSAWSETQKWSIGLLHSNDWQAKWIGQPKETIPPGKDAPSPWFRKPLTLSSPPVKATAYVASMGYHELFLNGNKVGEQVLAPAVSDYSKRAYYITYDVTTQLHKGENCLGLWLGRGWYDKKYPGVVWPGPLVRVQLEIELQNGKAVTILSDGTWKTHASNITSLGSGFGFPHSYGGGERLDFSAHLADWCQATDDDSKWPSAIEVEPAPHTLVAQMVQGNRKALEISPVSLEEIAPGEYQFDMGRNYTGWFELHFHGTAGKAIQIEYTEQLVPQEELATYHQVDECLPAGEGETVFCNRFNYHSFRFAKVTGLTKPPQLSDARGWLIHTDYNKAGTFACSNELLTKIYDTVVWTYRCVSLGGHVVDCPHRERLGYGGDGQVTMETGLYSFDTSALNTNWLGNWRDVQDPATGELPNIAPNPHPAGGGPTWGGICILLPWQLYLHNADTRILEECYPMMQAYLQFLESKSENNLLQPYGHKLYGFLGDWVAPDRDTNAENWSKEEWRTFFNNCYYVYALQLTSKIADVLEKPDHAKRYAQKYRTVMQATHEKYFHADKNTYVNGEQPYLALPLLIGMVPESQQKKVLANLVNEIKEKNKGHLQTGMHGTYFLIKCLEKFNRNDLVYSITNQKTYPGWGHMLEQGATTIWERWDGKASRIHSTLLAIGPWFPETVCGIRPDEKSPGFKHTIIRPQFVGDLTWARATHDTQYGQIACAWNRHQDKLHVEITIPANTTATVYLPTAEGMSLTESGTPLEKVDGVTEVQYTEEEVVIKIGSGQYRFLRQPTEKVSSAPRFWDEGFRIATVRTDYDSQDEGTATNPLTFVPCLYSKQADPLIGPAGANTQGSQVPCAMGPTTFSTSNPYTSADSWPLKNFWVLSVNNEFAYDNKRNTGPPNQSLALKEPGKGVFGFSISREKSAGKDVCWAHLALDQSLVEPSRIGIPFLGIGADASRGNGQPLSYLNPSDPSQARKIQFVAKLHRKEIGDKPGEAYVFWFYAFARWNGKPHMAMIALCRDGKVGGGAPFEHRTGDKHFRHAHWNWNIQESVFYPGADLVYLDIEDLPTERLALPRMEKVGEELQYTIDLQELFEIASRNPNSALFDEPLPDTSDIPVYGVHWAIEVAGPTTRLECLIRDIRTIE